MLGGEQKKDEANAVVYVACSKLVVPLTATMTIYGIKKAIQAEIGTFAGFIELFRLGDDADGEPLHNFSSALEFGDRGEKHFCAMVKEKDSERCALALLPLDQIVQAGVPLEQMRRIHGVLEARRTDDDLDGLRHLSFLKVWLGHVITLELDGMLAQPTVSWSQALKPLSAFSHLTELDLSWNNIEDLPECMPKTLRVFYANHNSLESIRPLFRCTEIIELYLDSNNLGVLDGLEVFTKMEVCFVGHNQLEKLHGLQPALRQLDICHNHLDVMPSCVLNLRQLQLLSCSGNPFPTPTLAQLQNTFVQIQSVRQPELAMSC